ncbi:hypothetical protein FACS1894106_4370 [Spirochaetia bacterium]|nr:hypothetical protein FACS1894106_4370 [Spirochaetia bacterium]
MSGQCGRITVKLTARTEFGMDFSRCLEDIAEDVMDVERTRRGVPLI